MDVAVVIPARDEAESLPIVLGDLPADVRRVVVDNGSTDRTAAVATSLGAEVVREPIAGYGRAVAAGLRHLRAEPPVVVVVLDADHSDPADLLHRLVDPILRDEADFVLSDRTRFAEKGALQPAQRFGNWLAVGLIARTTGHRYRDMGPFRAIRWSSLEGLAMSDPTWGWNIEMQMKAAKAGLRIREVALPYRPRVHGKSKISGSIRGSVRAGIRILGAVATYR